MIKRIIEKVARREFTRAMNFSDGGTPFLPSGERKRERLLYMHIPFCESLCTYCSFNRVLFDRAQCTRYFKALRKEILLYKVRGYDFTGIYVGGGTPTVMVEELAETLALAKDSFSIEEISVETNPNHLNDSVLSALQAVGVNRLSVGVQSFNEDILRATGRYEKYGTGKEIAGRLAECSGIFDTLNADMIFNFPLQSEDILDRDLQILSESGLDQITYYPLMVSDSTRKRVESTLGRLEPGKEEKYYYMIVDRLSRSYRRSSAWCFSKKGSMIDEYIVDYDEYAGLGSGSIGYLNGCCYANTFIIEEYIEKLSQGILPLHASRRFSRSEQMRYDFVMRLFGMELQKDWFICKYGMSPCFSLWQDVLAFFLAGGLRYRSGKFYLSQKGCYLWVVIMREFFTSVNNFRDYCLKGLEG